MNEQSHRLAPLPSLDELGRDLLHVSTVQKALALTLPYGLFAAYFILAAANIWWAAVLAVVLLSFFTYGSVSHDLVHRNMRLPRWINETCLTTVELLSFRSGHAYRASHLHHHAHFPDETDIEAAAARLPLSQALFQGLTLQWRLWLWACRRRTPDKGLILAEGLGVILLLMSSIAALPWTIIPAVYAALVIGGSWIFPITTVLIPHNPQGKDPLGQTRLFRGRVLAWLALEHLYHLEHHLYPQVPHQNWPKLAKRLDPYFEAEGIVSFKLLF